MASERFAQIFHQSEHVHFVFLRKIFFHIELSYRFSEHGVRDGHGPFPERFFFLGTAHHAVIQFEIGIIEILSENTGGLHDYPGNKKILQFAFRKPRDV